MTREDILDVAAQVIRQMWGGLAIRLPPNARYAGLSRQIPESQNMLRKEVRTMESKELLMEKLDLAEDAQRIYKELLINDSLPMEGQSKENLPKAMMMPACTQSTQRC